MKPIYRPKGKAAEYCELAINIYNSCNHGCDYKQIDRPSCFAACMAERFGKTWMGEVKPRTEIVKAVKNQLKKGYVDVEIENTKQRIELKNQLIHLCFTCDPYPAEIDTTVTREIIKAIKDSGNHVQILTKGRGAERDFDLLNENDWFGVTISGNYESTKRIEPKAADLENRILSLRYAHNEGIKTWVSFEPVFEKDAIYYFLTMFDFVDLFRIGKLNYAPSEINWKEFGCECEKLAKIHGRNVYIKESLKKEMVKNSKKTQKTY